MKEERLSISPQELDLYIAKAKQLRDQEIARISGQLFKVPQRLMQRVSNKANQAINLDSNAKQSA